MQLSIPPSIWRDLTRKVKMCFNCFGSHNVEKCTSKNIWLSINCDRKHHTLIHIRFDINPCSINSKIISVHSERTVGVAAVSVQTKNNEMTINTYGDLDMSCRQSILPRSAASELNLDLKVLGQILNKQIPEEKEIDWPHKQTVQCPKSTFGPVNSR